MEFSEYLRAVQRRWPIVVVAVLLGLGLGYVTADPDARPARFSATHTLSVAVPGVSGQEQFGPVLSPSQIAVFTTAGAVPQNVAEAIDFDGSPQRLARQVDVQADDQLGIVKITATGGDQERAVEIADGFGEAITEELRVQTAGQLEEALDSAESQVVQYGTRIEEIDADLAFFPPNAAVLTAQRDALVNQYRVAYDRSQVLRSELSAAQGGELFTLERATARPVGEGLSLPDDTGARMAVLGFFGLGLGLAVAFVADRLDTRIRSRADISAVTSLPVLAEIPVLPRRNRHVLVTAVEPASPFAESYRNLRTMIDFMSVAGDPAAKEPDGDPRLGPQVILVTSPGPSEAKTTTVSHLAASYAETNRSVLILDCDFRRPRQHRIFDVEDRPGFSDALLDPSAFKDAEVMRDTGVNGLRLVPAGTPTDNPAHLFRLSRRLIEAARRQADVVLIDTPPLLTANDAAELMEVADTTLVTVRAHQTRRDSVQRISEQLERLDVPVAGVVLVATQEPAAGYSAYYSYNTPRTDNPHGWRRLLFWQHLDAKDRIHDEDIPAPVDEMAGKEGVGDEDIPAPVDEMAGKEGVGDEDIPAPVDEMAGKEGVGDEDIPAPVDEMAGKEGVGDEDIPAPVDRDNVGARSQ